MDNQFLRMQMLLDDEAMARLARRRSVPSSPVWASGCAGLMMAGRVILTLASYPEGGSNA